MGIDFYGRRPSSKDGWYFQQPVSGWRALHRLMDELCFDLIYPETFSREVNPNRCTNLWDEDTCSEMADRFERWLDEELDGYKLDLGDDERSEHEISYLDLREWVQFLRSCGGFEVW